MSAEPATLREALFNELDAPGSITKSRIRNLLIRYPETGPRIITTAEELDGLADKSVVLAADSEVWRQDRWRAVAWWDMLTDSDNAVCERASAVVLPAAVLYEPRA